MRKGAIVWLEPAPYNKGKEGIYVVVDNIVPKERYSLMQVHSGWFDTTDVSAHINELTVLQKTSKGYLLPYLD